MSFYGRMLAVITLFATTSCVQPSAYICQESSECSRDGVQGVCQENKFCSFPDDTCPSGERYGQYSGPASDACVQPESVSCGDGVINDGERCDGSQLGGMSCGALGLGPGALGCTTTCEFDVSECSCVDEGCEAEDASSDAGSSTGSGLSDGGELSDSGSTSTTDATYGWSGDDSTDTDTETDTDTDTDGPGAGDPPPADPPTLGQACTDDIECTGQGEACCNETGCRDRCWVACGGADANPCPTGYSCAHDFCLPVCANDADCGQYNDGTQSDDLACSGSNHSPTVCHD